MAGNSTDLKETGMYEYTFRVEWPGADFELREYEAAHIEDALRVARGEALIDGAVSVTLVGIRDLAPQTALVAL